MTGSTGDLGESESMLVVTVNKSVLRKNPGFSWRSAVLVSTSIVGSLISLRPSQRV